MGGAAFKSKEECHLSEEPPASAFSFPLRFASFDVARPFGLGAREDEAKQREGERPNEVQQLCLFPPTIHQPANPPNSSLQGPLLPLPSRLGALLSCRQSYHSLPLPVHPTRIESELSTTKLALDRWQNQTTNFFLPLLACLPPSFLLTIPVITSD